MIASLVLPTFGGVAFSMPAQPCPMQSADHQGHAMADAPCCEQMDKSDGVAKKSPCKPGQECKTGGVLQLAMPVLKAPLTLAHPLALNGASDFIPDRTPSGVWRPPRS